MMNLKTTDQKQEFHWKIENSAKLPTVKIDLYGYDIVETFLSIVRRLQAVLNDLKTKLQIHSFYKIYRIETQCPDGSNDVIRNYIK